MPRATPPGRLLAADGPVLAAAHGHASPLTLILLAVAGLAGYVLVCLARPTRRCPKCHGKRVIQRGRRHLPCPRCKATGRTRRLGATAVHRFWWLATGDHLMGRRRSQSSDRTED